MATTIHAKTMDTNSFNVLSSEGKKSASVVSAFTDDHFNRCTGKTESFSYLVFKITLIGEMEKIGTVAESYKSRRVGGSLGHVIDFKALAFIGRRLDFCGCISKHIVEHTGGNSSAVLLIG